MTSDQIRQTYIDFFGERDHKRLPSASLIPAQFDPSALFTVAGMHPLKPYFLGIERPPHPRVTTCQKTFRTADIDIIGTTTRHLTFFEMLGNFSFGDYFKEGAARFAWELSTEGFGFSPDDIWITVFGGDEALGVGTDYGGSLRWPAACVGVAALRPTVGLVPGTGQLPGLATPDGYRVPNPVSVQGALQVVGLLAREVADLSLGLDVVGGPDGLRPPGADLARLRVGWLTREDTTPVRTDVADAVVAIVEALARAGLSTVACPGLLDGAAQAYATLREADGLEDLRAFVAGREHLLGGSLQALLHELAPTDPVRLARAWAGAIPVRSRVLAALGAAEGRAPAPPVDVLVCPVAPVPAFHRDHPVVVAGQVLSGFELMPLCRAVSLLGLPALSVPVGVSDEGLPINVQVVGRPFEEATVLGVGGLIERVRPALPAPGRPAGAGPSRQPRPSAEEA